MHHTTLKQLHNNLLPGEENEFKLTIGLNTCEFLCCCDDCDCACVGGCGFGCLSSLGGGGNGRDGGCGSGTTVMKVHRKGKVNQYSYYIRLLL